MKKKVIMTVLAVAVMGATLTGCGASGKSESIESVTAKKMVQVAEDFENEVTEVKEEVTITTEAASDETKDTVSVPEAAATTEVTVAKDTEPAKETSATNQTPEQNASKEKENAEVDGEPYFGEPGNIDNLKVTFGSSDLYTKKELQSAVDYILGRFQVDFVDCVMTELNYDEAFSLSQCQVWADQYDADEAIVFTCTFNTTENYQELNMEPGQVCEGYNWILTRNEGEDWILQTWGY
ncbi:MAG: hypothetical protein IJP29_04765 [Lachnospiraceae bacterium]|nr:hypothetical protein [Lachnospiraceae bacterium]